MSWLMTTIHNLDITIAPANKQRHSSNKLPNCKHPASDCLPNENMKQKFVVKNAKKAKKDLIRTISLSAVKFSDNMKEIFRTRSEENTNLNKTVTEIDNCSKFDTDVRPLKFSPVSGPYRATQLWNNIISYLKANVELKRHRYKMRLYEHSFTGKQVVEVVYEYILNNRDAFCTDVNRNNCIKLCQSFLDKKVFEPVTCRDGDYKKATFESSTNKVYRFKDSSPAEEVSSSSDDDEQPWSQDIDHLGCDVETMRLVSSLVFDDDDIMNQTFMDVDECKITNKYNLQTEIAKGVPTAGMLKKYTSI